MVIFAKTVSIFLMVAVITMFLFVASVFLGLIGEPSYGGVLLVDSMFGGFILFMGSRLLWLYAKKKQAADSGVTSDA